MPRSSGPTRPRSAWAPNAPAATAIAAERAAMRVKLAICYRSAECRVQSAECSLWPIPYGLSLLYRHPHHVVAIVHVHHRPCDPPGEGARQKGGGMAHVGGAELARQRPVGAVIVDHPLDQPDGAGGAGGPGSRGDGVHSHAVAP